MLISILANLALEGGVIPPVTHHNVPIDTLDDKGGSDGGKLEEGGLRNRIINQDDETILFFIAKFIAEQSNNN